MRIVRKFTVVIGALCLVAMVIVTCAEVFMRYFLSSPIYGSAEMTQLFLGILVFAGMAPVARDRGHVNVSLFEPFFEKYLKRAYQLIYDIFALLGVTGVALILGWRVWDLTHYPESTVVLRMPMIWIVGGMFVLACLAIMGAFLALREYARPDTRSLLQSLKQG